MRKLAIFLLAILISSASLFGQEGHEITIEIEDLRDTTALLGYFYGESTYVQDTAKSNQKGIFKFDGSKKLPQGVYFLVLNKSRILDFVVGDDQHFRLKSKQPDYILNMTVTGDRDNELYFSNFKNNAQQNDKARPYIEALKDSTASTEEKANARKALEKLNEEVQAFQKELINTAPEAIVSKVLMANKRIEVPEAPEVVNERQFKYEYYKTHYWDNFDLSDPVLLRLPEATYKEKLMNYLDNLVIQHPDSIIKELDLLIARAKANEDTYKYATWMAVTKYQYPEIMGLDKVYVHLYDKYFATGEMDFWANEQLKKNLKDRADQLRNSLIGVKAPNLIMQNENLERKSLYDITNNYTVIYFFDPDCGHCKKETPKLVEFYNSTDFDVEVFAVSADTSMTKMKNYIKEMEMPWITVNGPRTYTVPYHQLYDAMTTPTIYVLDKQKQIIAKKLPAERLEEFLTRYEAINEEKKTGDNQ